MKHLDLFSGIGGFALAASRVWPNHEVVGFCEIDPFCQKVLKKHWPGVPIYDDIKTLKGSDFDTVELISGGFPCQPYSVAGKRRGKEDDRALWPEMLRVISEVHPTWIVGENVGGFIHMGLDDCITDLEGEGYEVQSFIIPACAVGAPHRRDRVWIVAHAGDSANRADRGEVREKDGVQKSDRAKMGSKELGGTDGNAADTRCKHGEQGRGQEPGQVQAERTPQTDKAERRCEDAADTSNQGLQSPERPGPHGQRPASHGPATQCHNPWDEPWIEAASRLCKFYARIPNRLDGCLTYPETHGMMGFILTLRRYHYATSQEERAQKILPILRGAFNEKTVQRCFGELSKVFAAEDLRCSVHGKMDGERKSDEESVRNQGQGIQERQVRDMRNVGKAIHPSQGRKLGEQCTCEFDDIMFELSSEIALGEWKKNAEKAENILFNMWQESSGQRFLHEPLQALYEIWRSVTDKEIGAFRRHYLFRDKYRTQKLKALGNAIVPQVAEQIFKAIKEVD